MYISMIKMHNFKGFLGDSEARFDSGVNFLVGNNNCGKTSVFSAINFIFKKQSRDEVITKNLIDDENEYVAVEIEICGDNIENYLESDSNLKRYKAAMYQNESGVSSIRIKRTSEDIGKVLVYSPEKDTYENIPGIDKTISVLFEPQFVWADTSSSDIVNFSNTKVCGKIINTVVGANLGDNWKRLKDVHAETFKDINSKLKPVEEKIEAMLSEQYGGEAEVNFHFSLPEVSEFLKTGNLELSEDGITTASSEKGTGMQRALALTLIQVFADIYNKEDDKHSKPILFFLDEPETFLHPKAQEKLIDALEKISGQSQTFIITHSPYLLRKYKKETHSINIFSRTSGVNKIKAGIELGILGPLSPSWGEINYHAFDISSNEFHNELYGYLQELAANNYDSKYYSPAEFDSYLVDHSIPKDIDYIHITPNGERKYKTTLSTYIRNQIHHPENQKNTKFSEDQLEESVNLLIRAIEQETNI